MNTHTANHQADVDLDVLLNTLFAGRVVRKDLTKLLKEGANVPVFVLEYLLGMYCAIDDEETIADGMRIVKNILADNYVRPDEAEMVKSRIREEGHFKIIDKVTVKLNEKRDVYEALLSNLGVRGVEIPSTWVRQYEKLLVGGIWCILTLQYHYEEGGRSSPFLLTEMKPIQMPGLDLEALFEGRRGFTENQWLDVLLRSTGLEPTVFEARTKWHLLARLIPLVENNYNLCELGPRGTGKSHVYKEISPNSILVSGGQTTVPNLFYNMSSRKVGLVGAWDVVAFDEVAGIRFKDQDGVQIMKDFMASGSFSRGRDVINANAALVFVGNINQSIDSLVKTGHLFAPFPEAMIDAAFFDRMHAYIPGWEIPKLRPECLTNRYGLIVDFLAEFCREMRKRSFSDALDAYFKIGNNLNQRDVIAVRKTVSGLLKLLYPHGEYNKDVVERCLAYAMESRRRVKEQLKKIGGMEFYDVHFSYIDTDRGEETFISVPEQRGGALIPEGPLPSGTLHTVVMGTREHLGLYRLELQVVAGTGKLSVSGSGADSKTKEAIKIAFDYFKANVSRVSSFSRAGDQDYHVHIVDIHNTGPAHPLTLCSLLAFCSGLMGKPVMSQLIVVGNMSLGGSIVPGINLAETLQVAFDSGARRILLPMSNVNDIPSVPGELFAKFQTSFYSDPVDAVFKALGVA